ncbi:MAG: right-handed parallel beta-helix repeat-containing protein [bacterium]
MENKKNIQLVLLTMLFIVLTAILSACGLFSPDEKERQDTSSQTPSATSSTASTASNNGLLFLAEGQAEVSQTPSTTFPIVIDQPGNYTLTGNITVSTLNVNGIKIRAGNVTLDLAGYTITGPGSGGSGVGIFVSQGENAQIMNGAVQNFLSGISLSGSNHQVRNITSSHNSSFGIEAGYSLITDCQAISNGSHGFKANSSTITNCTANSNSSCGLQASESTVTGCTAQSNSSHGICTYGKCRIEGNIMRNNGGYGLYLNPDYSYAIKNKAGNNTAGDFYQTGNHYLPVSGLEANVVE